MKMNRLGRTDIRVSELCLGSMTWGSQNTEAEGHAQIDYALDHGINFIDTAEMYPTTPMQAETFGGTEAVIGTWIQKTGRRDDVVIATKITGQGSAMVKDGAPITGARMRAALDASLSRLKTDYVDLYQLHWSNRGSYHFRRAFAYDPSGQDGAAVDDHIADILNTADDLVQQGKIRALGLSNETAWGATRFAAEAARSGLPRVASIQNEYSLLCRLFDLDLAEVAHHEDIGLMAWSPLAAGILSGKYGDDARPEGSRRRVTNDTLNGRINPHSEPAAAAYVALARAHGLDPAQMALAFCLTRPFMMSVIIGATTPDQLATNIAAADLTLSQAVLDGIAEIHRAHPIPM